MVLKLSTRNGIRRRENREEMGCILHESVSGGNIPELFHLHHDSLPSSLRGVSIEVSCHNIRPAYQLVDLDVKKEGL